MTDSVAHGYDYPAHPAAGRFPLMSAERLEDLAHSIRESGLIVPIVLCDGQVLDGRNRLQACEMAGVAPRFIHYDGNPYEYSWDMNGARRDLEAGQRAAIRLLLDRDSEGWHEAQRKKVDEANRKRSQATKEQHKVGNPRVGKISGGISPDIPPEVKKEKERTSVELAARAGVGEATAARVQAVANADESLLVDVASGAVKLTEASRIVKQRKIAERGQPMPTANQHRVIYADPPWKYNDSRAGLADYAHTAAEDQYPTMSVADLCALDVKAMAEPDAVLFCWATFPLLPDALQVVKAWGFTYKTAFVWHKMRTNFGHYHTASAELLLVCTRGSCTPDADAREPQVIEIPRTRHSAKPEAFRELVDRMYPYGPRIELFRRGDAPKGWAVWGNEAAA